MRRDVSVNVTGRPCRRFLKSLRSQGVRCDSSRATTGSSEVSSGCHGHETNSASIVDVGRRVGRTGRLPVGPRFAWWKHDEAPEDTSAVARSATTPLPSAQSTPQAVAIAGLTPATSPSSTNLAAAGPTGATATPPASGDARCFDAAGRAIGYDSSHVVDDRRQRTARRLSRPTNALADKLVSTPNTKSAAAAPPAAPR